MSDVDSYGAGISLIIIDILVIVGNIVLLAIIANLRRSYPGNDLQSCLAVSDFISGIFPMPIAIFAYFFSLWDISTDFTVCEFFAWISFFSKAESAIILSVIALYHCLTQRGNWLNPDIISKRLMWTCIAATIPVGVIAALPMMVSSSQPLIRPFGEAYCHFDYTLTANNFLVHYTAAIATMGCILFTVVGACALFIIFGFRKYNQREKQSNYKQQSRNKMNIDEGKRFRHHQEIINIVIFALFLMCYIPFMILLVMALSNQEVNPKFDFLSVRLMSITAMFNPLIATFGHPLYRKELGSMITKLFRRCYKKPNKAGDHGDWENSSIEPLREVSVSEINNLSARKTLDNNHNSNAIDMKPAAAAQGQWLDPFEGSTPLSACPTCHRASRPATTHPPAKLHPAVNANNLDVDKKGILKYANLRQLELGSSTLPGQVQSGSTQITCTTAGHQNSSCYTRPEIDCDRCLMHQQKFTRNTNLKKKQIQTPKRQKDDIRNIRCYSDSPQNVISETDEAHDRPPSSNSVHVRIEYNQRERPSSNDEISSITTGNETVETITTVSEISGSKSDMAQNMLISGLKKTQDPRLFNLLFQSAMTNENQKKKDMNQHTQGSENEDSSLSFVHNILSTIIDGESTGDVNRQTTTL